MGGRHVRRSGPRPPGWPYLICPVRGGDRAGAGAPCAPPQRPDYIYQRVVSPEAPVPPSPVTRSGQGGPSRQDKSGISPPPLLLPGFGPLLCGLAGGSNPSPPARSGQFRPAGGRSGPGCALGNHRGALAVRRAPHPAITLRIHPGRRGAAVSEAAGPGAPTAPPCSAAHDRPAGPHRRPRRRPEPRPRGAPRRPTGRSLTRPRRPLEPRPVRRRARAAACAPRPFPCRHRWFGPRPRGATLSAQCWSSRWTAGFEGPCGPLSPHGPGPGVRGGGCPWRCGMPPRTPARTSGRPWRGLR